MASSGNVNWMGIIGLIGSVLMIAGLLRNRSWSKKQGGDRVEA